MSQAASFGALCSPLELTYLVKREFILAPAGQLATLVTEVSPVTTKDCERGPRAPRGLFTVSERFLFLVFCCHLPLLFLTDLFL